MSIRRPWHWSESLQVVLAFVVAIAVSVLFYALSNRLLDRNVRSHVGVSRPCAPAAAEPAADSPGADSPHRPLCEASHFAELVRAAASVEELPDSNQLGGVSAGPPEARIVGALLYGTAGVSRVAPELELLQYLQTPAPTVAAVLTELLGEHPPLADSVQFVAATELLATLVGEVRDELHESRAFQWRRYLNGPIQFWTVVLAVAGVVLLLVAHLPLAYRERLLLRNPGRFGVGDSLFLEVPTTLDPPTRSTLEAYVRHVGTWRSHFDDQPSFVFDVIHDTAMSSHPLRGDSHAQASQTLSLAVEQIKSRLDSRMGIVRWIAWAVPSVGFIGTLIGIGTALENAHQVVGKTDGFAQTSAIQLITGDLGSAFDTTLIALLASLPLMLLMHLVTRFEEDNADRLFDGVKRGLLRALQHFTGAHRAAGDGPRIDPDEFRRLQDNMEQLRSSLEEMQGRVARLADSP